MQVTSNQNINTVKMRVGKVELIFFVCEIHSCFHVQSDNITLWHQLEIKCLLRLVLVMILIATDMVIKECKL